MVKLKKCHMKLFRPTVLIFCCFLALTAINSVAKALDAFRVPLDVDAIEITSAINRYSGDSGRLKVRSVPGPDGVIHRIEVSSVDGDTESAWMMFALTNESDRRIDRLITTEPPGTFAFQIPWAEIRHSGISFLFSTRGSSPERDRSISGDIFRITLDPKETVTYIAELRSPNGSSVYLWVPDAYRDREMATKLYYGLIIGIIAAFTLFLIVIAFITRGMMATSTAFMLFLVVVYGSIQTGLIRVSGLSSATDQANRGLNLDRVLTNRVDSRLSIRMIPENVTLIPRADAQLRDIEDRVVIVRRNETLDDILNEAGANRETIRRIIAALGSPRGRPAVSEGQRLRIMFTDLDAGGKTKTIARLSVFTEDREDATVALADSGDYVQVALMDRSVPHHSQRVGRGNLNDWTGGSLTQQKPVPPRQTQTPVHLPPTQQAQQHSVPQRPAAEQAAHVAQRAAILIQAAVNDQQNVETHIGTTVWQLEESRRPGANGSTAVRADVDIATVGVKFVLLIEKNNDATLRASHMMTLRFLPQAGTTLPGVAEMGSPQMRNETSPAVEPLAGAQAKITDNIYIVALNADPSLVSRNIEMLKTLGWFDFPIRLADGRIAKITIEKGAPGEELLNRATKYWHSAP